MVLVNPRQGQHNALLQNNDSRRGGYASRRLITESKGRGRRRLTEGAGNGSIADYCLPSEVLAPCDIFYHGEDFLSRNKNICFVTGLMGSGKSVSAKGLMRMQSGRCAWVLMDWLPTLAITNMPKEKLMHEWAEADISLMHHFFLREGCRFRITKETLTKAMSDEDFNQWSRWLFRSFVFYLMAEAKKNQDISFVVDGVQLARYWWDCPQELRNYPLLVKGTSPEDCIERAIARHKKELLEDGKTETEQEKRKWEAEFAVDMADDNQCFKPFFEYFKNLADHPEKDAYANSVNKELPMLFP